MHGVSGDLRLQREVAERPATVKFEFQNERLAAVAVTFERRLALTTTWQTPRTEIVLSAAGRPQRVTLRIRHTSRELERAAELRAIEDL